MKKIVLATAAVIAMSSFAIAQQSTSGGSKPNTIQQENTKSDKMDRRTTGSSAPGSGSGTTIDSNKNQPQAVPPSNGAGSGGVPGGAAK